MFKGATSPNRHAELDARFRNDSVVFGYQNRRFEGIR